MINAARSRTQQLNYDAVAKDRSQLHAQIDKANRIFWETAGNYDDKVHRIFEWSSTLEAISEAVPEVSGITFSRLQGNADIDFARVRRFVERLRTHQSQISLKALVVFFQRQNELPKVLETCEELNRMHSSVPVHMLNEISSIPSGIDDFEKVVSLLAQHVEPSSPVR